MPVSPEPPSEDLDGLELGLPGGVGGERDPRDGSYSREWSSLHRAISSASASCRSSPVRNASCLRGPRSSARGQKASTSSMPPSAHTRPSCRRTVGLRGRHLARLDGAPARHAEQPLRAPREAGLVRAGVERLIGREQSLRRRGRLQGVRSALLELGGCRRGLGQRVAAGLGRLHLWAAEAFASASRALSSRARRSASRPAASLRSSSGLRGRSPALPCDRLWPLLRRARGARGQHACDPTRSPGPRGVHSAP